MKTFIIRKPKFMRNEEGFKAYVKCIETIDEALCNTRSKEERDYLIRKIRYCTNKAVEAGGFFNAEDFIKWMYLQKKH